MWGEFGNHMGGMWLWSVIGLGVLLLLVWAVVRAGAGGGAGPGGESPETILKQRYARGDIDRDEYEQRLSDLRK